MKSVNLANVHASWGKQDKHISKEKFIEVQTRLWVELKKSKQFVGTVLSHIVFAASVSAISWGVADAVSEGQIKNIS